MRSLATLAAALLGLVAVCLVMFATTQKQLQIGVLLGLWGGLIATFLVFGSRRSQAEQAAQLTEAERRARDLHAAQLQVSQLQQAQLTAADEARSRQEVELRKLGELQLSREAAARREADLHLELSLRHEIERMMNEQIGLLRDEVAALRAEVVDKLGGQLRLERIETTRLIGSDLEALQHEIRRLAGQDDGSSPPAQLARARPAIPARRADLVQSERADAGHPQAAWSQPTVVRAEPTWATEPVRAPEPSHAAEASRTAEPTRTVEPAREASPSPAPPTGPAEPIRSEPASAEPSSAPTSSAQPSSRDEREHPSPADRGKPADRELSTVPAGNRPLGQPTPPDPLDMFAGLPRLSPLPADLELLPDPSPAASGGAEGAMPSAEGQPPLGYHGRRRASDEDGQPAMPPEGGRRRAPDNAPDDLLARIRQP